MSHSECFLEMIYISIVGNTTWVHRLLHKGSNPSVNVELHTPVQLNASFAEGDKVAFVVFNRGLSYYGNSMHEDYMIVS